MVPHEHPPPSPAARLAEHEAHWRRFGVHRASQKASQPAISTGWALLDALLPGGGYPLGAVTELLVSTPGIGELSLLFTALAAQMAAYPRRRLALVSPPAQLNAPALSAAGIDRARTPVVHCANDSERVWCVEQMAGADAFAAFVVWGDRLDGAALRRLQLVAERASCPVFVYRDLARAGERSPAALRLTIRGEHGSQQIEMIKCRGPAGARMIGLTIDRDRIWRMPDADMRPAWPAANNDMDDSDVARPAISPLGTR